MTESGAPILESLDERNFAGIGVASRRRLQQQFLQNQRQNVSPILLSHKDHRDISIPQSQFLPKCDQDTSMYGAQSRLSCGRFPRFAKAVHDTFPTQTMTPTSIIPVRTGSTPLPTMAPMTTSSISETSSPVVHSSAPTSVHISPITPKLRLNTSSALRQQSSASLMSMSSTNTSNFSLPLTPAPSSMSYQAQDMLAARASPALSIEPSSKPFRQSGLDALDMAFWSGDGFYSDDEDDPMPYASQNMLAQKRQPQCAKPLPDVRDAENHLHLNIIDEYLSDAAEPMTEHQRKDNAALLHEEYESQLRSLRCKSQLVMCNNPSVVQVQDTAHSVSEPTDSSCCSRCHQFVEGRKICGKDNSILGIYHPDCVRCSDCDDKLAKTDIFMYQGKILCLWHYQVRSGTVCHACGQGIIGIFRKTSKGECYHPTCMVCAYSDAASGPCLLQLTDYFSMNQKMYCEKHARQVAQSLSSR